MSKYWVVPLLDDMYICYPIFNDNGTIVYSSRVMSDLEEYEYNKIISDRESLEQQFLKSIIED